MKTCESCAHWDPSTQLTDEQPDTTGLCRKNSPVVNKRTGRGCWPFTSDDDWCAEYEARPEVVPCPKSPDCAHPAGHPGECDEIPF